MGHVGSSELIAMLRRAEEMQLKRSARAACLSFLLAVSTGTATELDFSFSTNPSPLAPYGGSASNTDAFHPNSTLYGSYISNGDPYGTWLWHDFGGGNWDWVNPLTQHPDGGVGWSPQIAVKFTLENPDILQRVYLDPAYGDLVGVLYSSSSDSGEHWPISFSDDNTLPTVNPLLHGFDVAYFGGGTLAGVRVSSWDGANVTHLWEQTDVVVPANGHVSFDFGVPLEGTEESLWINFTTQPGEPIFNVALDNIVISQTDYPATQTLNLLKNSDLETAAPSDWSLGGESTYRDSSPWFGSATAHSPTHYVGAASNGGTATGTLSQSIGLPLGATNYNLTLSFWGLIHDVGGDPDSITGQIIVDDVVVASVAMTQADGLDTYVQKQVNWVGSAGSEIRVNLILSANGSGGGGNWGVVCVDDITLDAVTLLGQHTIDSIDPTLIADNLSVTPVTITGTDLTGATSVQLVQGATVLEDPSPIVAGDGLSLTATLPTNGAPFGVYDVIVTKGGALDAEIPGGFHIRDSSGSLLLNGSFEELPIDPDGGANGNIIGWQKWYSGWGGSPAIENLYVGGASDPFIWVPQVGGIDTPVVDGAYSFRSGEFQENGGEGGIYQQVPVIPGEELVLSFQWGGGHTRVDSAMEIGVLAGAHEGYQYVPDDFLPGGLLRYENPDGFGWEQASLTFTVPPDKDRITVYTKIWHLPLDPPDNPDKWNQVALWIDNMSLTSPQCPDQHELTSIDPVSADANTALDLTVFGSNMDLVTAIRLVRGQDQIVGEIQPGASGSQLVAHFMSPPGGATPGNYDVVTEQDGCLGRILAQTLTLSCGAPSSLTGVNISQLTKPQGVVEMIVSGTNVDLLDEVKLVHTPDPRDPPGDRAPHWVPISEITGTIVDASDPDNVVMEFDLLSAQAGRYKLVGVRNDVCGDPPEVLDVLEMLLPEGANLLVNPGFEEGTVDPWVITADAGLTVNGEPIPGPELINGTPPLIDSACDGGAPFEDVDGWVGYAASEGSYWIGTRAISLNFSNWITPNSGSIEQSVGLPLGPGNYSLTATAQVRMWDKRAPGSSLTLFFVIDGEEQPGVTAALVDGAMTEDGADPYTTVSVDFIGNAASDITLKMHVSTDASTGFAFCPEPTLSIVAIDEIKLIGSAACPAPFADADEDGDIDSKDYAALQLCIGDDPLPDECRCFDTDLSGVIDASDVSDFMDCATGPAVLHQTHPNPGCIEQP